MTEEQLNRFAMRFNQPTEHIVAILPLGTVPESEIDLAETVLTNVFNVKVNRMETANLSNCLYDYNRHQWDADRLLGFLFDKIPDNASRIMGIINEDMFSPGYTFNFGFAHYKDGVFVYSPTRLKESYYGREKNEETESARRYRVMVHEFGHTFGNSHCTNDCVMQSVSFVETADALGKRFCEECHKKVEEGLQISPTSAEGIFLRAGALFRRRHLSLAIETFRQATVMAPFEPRFWNDLGVALLTSNDRDQAQAAFRRAAELKADFPHPYYNLGLLCRKTDEAVQRDQYFAAGLKLDPKKCDGHKYLARLYEELFDDICRAKEHYRAYFKLGGDEQDVEIRAANLGIFRREVLAGRG